MLVSCHPNWRRLDKVRLECAAHFDFQIEVRGLSEPFWLQYWSNKAFRGPKLFQHTLPLLCLSLNFCSEAPPCDGSYLRYCNGYKDLIDTVCGEEECWTNAESETSVKRFGKLQGPIPSCSELPGLDTAVSSSAKARGWHHFSLPTMPEELVYIH